VTGIAHKAVCRVLAQTFQASDVYTMDKSGASVRNPYSDLAYRARNAEAGDAFDSLGASLESVQAFTNSGQSCAADALSEPIIAQGPCLYKSLFLRLRDALIGAKTDISFDS
jgi:hypothetical protein